MKKARILATALACVLALSANVFAHDEVTYAEWGTPTIDGQWEECWDNAQYVDIADQTTDVDASLATTAKVWSLWDGEYIYFFAKVTDPEIFAEIKDDPTATWNQDAIGFMIDYAYNREEAVSYRDLGADSYAGYVNVGAVEGDFNKPEDPSIFGQPGYADDVESYCVITGEGYDIEIQLPLARYKDYVAGDKLGFEICANGATTEATRDHQAVWKHRDGGDGGASWQYSANMGTLILNEKPAETEAEVVEAAADTVAAPQTFDAGMIAAVAAIVSAAGYALSKKR